MTTGELIKKYREEAKLTQSELAVRIGTTPQNISQYERGLRNPKLETVQRIADAINVDFHSLIDLGQSDDAAPSISSEKERHSIRTAFSERLKYLRDQKCWSQQRLADELGVSKSSVNMYERGEREPGFETMEAIADIFKVDMNYLHGKSGDNMSKYLYDRRIELGLTQKEVANFVGVSEATVSRWESGDIANMRRDRIMLYAQVLKTDLSFITNGKSDLCETASKEAFSTRLINRMAELQLRQVDLLEKIRQCCSIKVSKSDLSQYVAGKVTPGPEKLYALSVALDVNECWLLGYNVPSEQTGDTSHSIRYAIFGAPCTDAQYEEVKQFARFILLRDSQK